MLLLVYSISTAYLTRIRLYTRGLTSTDLPQACLVLSTGAIKSYNVGSEIIYFCYAATFYSSRARQTGEGGVHNSESYHGAATAALMTENMKTSATYAQQGAVCRHFRAKFDLTCKTQV